MKKADHTALTKCLDDLLAGAVTWVTSVGVNSATCVCICTRDTLCMYPHKRLVDVTGICSLVSILTSIQNQPLVSKNQSTCGSDATLSYPLHIAHIIYWYIHTYCGWRGCGLINASPQLMLAWEKEKRSNHCLLPYNCIHHTLIHHVT